MTTEDENNRTPWIKIRISLQKHRKVIQLKEMLDLHSRQEALGVIIDLFTVTFIHCWADGDWKKSSPGHLEDLLDWRGKPGELYKALQECEFMEGNKVRNWEKHQRRLVGERIRYYERSGRTVPGQDPNETRLRAKASLAARKATEA